MGKIPRVAIDLDRRRHLVVDLNAMDLAEELTGRNLLDLSAWAQLNAGGVKRLLFACLKTDDDETRGDAPPLTLEALGALIHPSALREVMNLLLESCRLSLPDSKPEDEQDEDAEGNPPEGTGPPL